MPKRSYSNVAPRELLPENPPKRDSAPNNLRHGSDLLDSPENNQGGFRAGLSALQAFNQKLQDFEVPLPGQALILASKQREQEIAKLTDMTLAFPEAQKRYSVAEKQQWHGLTPVVEEIVIQAVRTGLPRRRAVAMAGCTLHQLKQWLDMGAQGLSPFANFSVRFHQVEAFDELKATQLVYEAASAEMKTTGTYFRMLERRHKAEDELFDDEKDAALPFDRFTTAELEAYTNSGGKTIPDRFKNGVTVDAIQQTSDEDGKDAEIARLRAELAAQKHKGEEEGGRHVGTEATEAAKT